MNRRFGLGPLGRRLLVAFMVVATVSVGVFAFVGVIGLDLEFNREQLRVQQDVASHTAARPRWSTSRRAVGGRRTSNQHSPWPSVRVPSLL